MLVLSRKVGEEIVIGENIQVKVVAIQGGHVRIGISAPEEIMVDRSEVHEKRMKPLNAAAVLTPRPILSVDLRI